METGKEYNGYPEYNPGLLITGVLAMIGSLLMIALAVMFWMLWTS